MADSVGYGFPSSSLNRGLWIDDASANGSLGEVWKAGHLAPEALEPHRRLCECPGLPPRRACKPHLSRLPYYKVVLSWQTVCSVDLRREQKPWPSIWPLSDPKGLAFLIIVARTSSLHEAGCFLRAIRSSWQRQRMRRVTGQIQFDGRSILSGHGKSGLYFFLASGGDTRPYMVYVKFT